MLKRLNKTSLILPILCLIMALGIACATTLAPGDQSIQESGSTFVVEHIPNKPGVVYAQGDVDAAIGELPRHLIPSTRGAGVEIDCGGTYPGLRGSYVSTITRNGTILEVVHQVPDDTQLGKVRCDTNNISLAGAGADGVVSAGAFSSDLMNLILTITTGGTDTTVTVPVPAGVRAGASLSDALPQAVVVTGGAAGVLSDVSRADHVHPGDRQRSFGSHTPSAIAATGSTGTNTTVLPSDHVHGGQRTFALSNPSDVTTGTSTVGSSDLLSRADHTHGGDTDTQRAYGSGTPAVVVTGSGSAGTATTVSRFDHQHGGDTDTDTQRSYESSNPTTVGDDGQSAGTDADVSRGDHKHQLDTDQRLPINATQGQAAIWDNTNNVWIADDVLTTQSLPVYVASAAATQTAQTFAFVATPSLGLNPRLGATVVWKTPSTVSPVTNDPQINLSITGGPTGINVSLANGMPLNVSELEANAPYIVVWDNTQWRIPDAVETGSGGGVNTFADLTDTPNSYTNQERRIVRVNDQGTALEFVTEPPQDHAIENFGRIPPATASSPDLIYITHDYTVGTRQDATLTVGVVGSQVGYSDGHSLPAMGSVSESSPLIAMYGTGTASNYDIRNIRASNRNWLDSLSAVRIEGTNYSITTSYYSGGVYHRTIVGPPTGLNLATLSFNFEFTDGTWQFTDAGTEEIRGGLYEKVQRGDLTYVYIRISLGEQHVDSILPPTGPPDFAGQLYVSNEGKLWVAGDEISTVTTEPSIMSSIFSNAYALVSASQCSTDLTDGQFVATFSGGLAQRQGNCPVTAVSWVGAWTYIVANVESTPALRALRDDTVMLGEWTIDAEQEAAEARERETDNSLTYFYIDSRITPHEIRRIDTFTPGAFVDEDYFFWRGFHTVGSDVYEIVADTVDPNPSAVTISDILETIDLGLPAVGYRVGYTRPDSSGNLPDPTENDFAHTQLAFDGTHEYGVARRLVTGHNASATFTNVLENNTFSAGGNNWRWRTFHHHDSQVQGRQEYDFYINFGCTCVRIFESIGSQSAYWRDMPATHPLSSVLNWIPGIFTSQADALGHVMADGQRTSYHVTNGTVLATVSSFVAAADNEYEYTWETIGGDGISVNPVATTETLNTVAIGEGTYDVGNVIAADVNGTLRDARASDWDTANGRPRTLAYDGRRLFRTERTLVDNHTSSATYAEVPIGTAIEAWFWRGVHNADNQAGNNPQDGWIYYNIFTERLRVFSLVLNRWDNIPANHVVPDEFNLVGFPDPGVFDGENLAESQGNALAYVSANGQRFLASDGPVGTIKMYQVSNYVAANPGHYLYDWIEAKPIYEDITQALTALPGDPIHADFNHIYAHRDNAVHNTGGLEYKVYYPETWLHMTAGAHRYSANTEAAIGAVIQTEIEGSNRTFGSIRPSYCDSSQCFYLFEEARSTGYRLSLHFDESAEHDLEDYAQIRIRFREAGTTGAYTTVTIPRFSTRIYILSDVGGTLSDSVRQTRRETLQGNWFDVGTSYEIIFEHRATNNDPWTPVDINPAEGYTEDILIGSDRHRIDTMAHRNIGDIASSGNIWLTLDLRAPLPSYADADIMRLEIENSLLNQTCEWPMSVVQKLTDRNSDTQTTGYSDNQVLGCTINSAHTSDVRELDEFSALVLVKNSDGQLAVTAGQESTGEAQAWEGTTENFLQEVTINLRAVYYGGGRGDGTAGGGGGTADQITVDATNFDGMLSGTDTDVQEALETLDELRIANTLMISTNTTYNSSTNILNLVTPFRPLTGDIVTWVAPSGISSDSDDISITATTDGMIDTAYPLHDIHGIRLSGNDLNDGQIYEVVFLGSINQYRLIEPVVLKTELYNATPTLTSGAWTSISVTDLTTYNTTGAYLNFTFISNAGRQYCEVPVVDFIGLSTTQTTETSRAAGRTVVCAVAASATGLGDADIHTITLARNSNTAILIAANDDVLTGGFIIRAVQP